ncbi:MAG TPA: thioesterase family protein [Polyangiaceae bacterium]|nr:thioesterase family protein [Polyangiaceae bacterium]
MGERDGREGAAAGEGAPPAGDEKGPQADDRRARDEGREAYPHFLQIPTRWIDNDVYGHVNNVVYYAFFDTVINRYLIDRGVLDLAAGATIGVAVETRCRFFRSIAFPEVVEAGLRVGRVGGSSVRYEVGLFVEGRAEIAASGHFVHVFVDRAGRRPVPIAGELRAALEALLVG